jgi:uncharacterized protein YbjT (DUF2867 family)
MTKQVIAVLGGTGAQGGGVVDALLKDGQFRVRAAVRNPDSEGAQSLARRGCEVVQADILDTASMPPVFAGAYGAFLVTNFWDPAQMRKETAIGTALVKAARAGGVHHLVWSTLPDCDAIGGGRFSVRHFSDKARVDPVVAAAGFARHTFVQASQYFQNFLTLQPPQPLPGGGRGWAVPMDVAARVIHAGDPTEVGRAVAAAFAAGEQLQNGTYLAVCGGMYSWTDFVTTLNGLGHELSAVQVPDSVFDAFFEGAREMREMFHYFEEFTYFGPGHERREAAARALVPAGFTGFADWARIHMEAKPTTRVHRRDS